MTSLGVGLQGVGGPSGQVLDLGEAGQLFELVPRDAEGLERPDIQVLHGRVEVDGVELTDEEAQVGDVDDEKDEVPGEDIHKAHHRPAPDDDEQTPQGEHRPHEEHVEAETVGGQEGDAEAQVG